MLKIKVRRDVFEKIMNDREPEKVDIEKSRIPKYIKKIPLGNGNYKYIYYDDKKLQKKIDFTLCKTLNCTKTNAAKKGGQFLKDWQDDWKNNPEKSKVWALNNEKVYLKTKGDNKISLFHFTHKGGGKLRTPDEIFQRALLLPLAKTMLESENKCRVYQARKYSDRVEYELVGKTKINGKIRIISVIISKFYGQNKVYISTINKAVSEIDTACITDVYFTDPKTLTSQIKLNLGFPVNESRQSKTLSGNTLTLPGKTQGAASGNYAIRQPKHNLTIPQNGKMSNIKLNYNGAEMLHKSFDIEISDITEANREKKAEQTQKALNAIYVRQPFAIRHVKAESGEKVFDNLVLRISSFDKSKIEKAVHAMAFSLDTKIKSAGSGEAFNYKAQEELTDRFVNELTEKTKNLYSLLVLWLGLPEIRILSKSNLTYKGKILYNPENGEPIKQSEWKKFIKKVEDFLNKNYSSTGERIVLSAEALGRILERLSKTNSLEAIKKKHLENLSLGHKKFDWISDNVKNMKDVFGNTFTDRKQLARIQVAIDSAAQRVTRVTDEVKNDIQQVVIDGIKNRQSKAKISQTLFEKCVGLNRDFQKIADTEIQNNTNEAYIKEEVYNTNESEKVYFKRFELSDDNTCKKCRAIKGKIALFSETPLESEKIKDPYADFAIWEGKTDGVMPMGTVHPYCRGGWYRYYPETEKYRKD